MSRPSPSPAAPLAALAAAVALGGALGAVGRWAAVALTPGETGFPWTTFTINVTGSFALALVPAALVAVTSRRRHALAAAFLGPGVMGGWTTLSAYAEQTRSLLERGHPVTAGVYVAGTLAACLAAVALGDRLARAGAPAGARGRPEHDA
ncbi:hypothetical protein GCM10009737_15950 [Nocardioides lentus]|uniref:Fluoride-specific ion channel FluC n=1 Tax=Nocardioides lentus TaxID=338077 RepID=A0ABN2PCJ2_9ACTN